LYSFIILYVWSLRHNVCEKSKKQPVILEAGNQPVNETIGAHSKSIIRDSGVCLVSVLKIGKLHHIKFWLLYPLNNILRGKISHVIGTVLYIIDRTLLGRNRKYHRIHIL
jgi:hypothetical protein